MHSTWQDPLRKQDVGILVLGASAQCVTKRPALHPLLFPSAPAQVHYTWQDPLAGQGVDDFVMVGDELHVTTRIRLVSDPDKELTYTNVHFRYGAKPQ